MRHIRGFLPTRRLAAVVALTALAWLLSDTPTGLAAAAAVSILVVAAAVFDVVVSPRAGDFTVTRTLPSSVGLGDTADGEYAIGSASPRTVRGTLHDALPRGIVRAGELAPAFAVTTTAEAALPFGVAGRERGSHTLGPVVLRVTAGLGLIQRSFRYDPGDAILVTPSLAGVRRYRLLALQHRLRDAGIRNVRRRGQGTNFANLREYAVGDDPRHIDWKASARRLSLVSREYTVEQGQTVMIAVDAGRMMTQLAGAMSRFEYALSSALVLTDIALHSNDRVGLIVFDDVVRAFVPPARGRAALRLVRDALVAASATMVEPDYAMAFRTLAARHRKRSLIVLFTDVVDPRSSRAILAHTTRSAARHLPLVVALRNDQLMAAAQPGVDARTLFREEDKHHDRSSVPLGTAADGTTGRAHEGSPPGSTLEAARIASSTLLYESAAAEELVSAREEVLTRMRRAGVSVLDVSPQQMTPGVINRYLELKARASL